MSGYSIWGHDVGGYVNANFSPVSPPDLFMRWSQFGCFSPIMQMNRRSFLVASGGLSLSPLVPQTTGESGAPTDVTRRLARYIVSAKFADLAAPVRKEAARTLLNWVGCTVGGSRHETVVVAPFGQA